MRLIAALLLHGLQKSSPPPPPPPLPTGQTPASEPAAKPLVFLNPVEMKSAKAASTSQGNRASTSPAFAQVQHRKKQNGWHRASRRQRKFAGSDAAQSSVTPGAVGSDLVAENTIRQHAHQPSRNVFSVKLPKLSDMSPSATLCSFFDSVGPSQQTDDVFKQARSSHTASSGNRPKAVPEWKTTEWTFGAADDSSGDRQAVKLGNSASAGPERIELGAAEMSGAPRLTMSGSWSADDDTAKLIANSFFRRSRQSADGVGDEPSSLIRESPYCIGRQASDFAHAYDHCRFISEAILNDVNQLVDRANRVISSINEEHALATKTRLIRYAEEVAKLALFRSRQRIALYIQAEILPILRGLSLGLQHSNGTESRVLSGFRHDITHLESQADALCQLSRARHIVCVHSSQARTQRLAKGSAGALSSSGNDSTNDGELRGQCSSVLATTIRPVIAANVEIGDGPQLTAHANAGVFQPPTHALDVLAELVTTSQATVGAKAASAVQPPVFMSDGRDPPGVEDAGVNPTKEAQASATASVGSFAERGTDKKIDDEPSSSQPL